MTTAQDIQKNLVPVIRIGIPSGLGRGDWAAIKPLISPGPKQALALRLVVLGRGGQRPAVDRRDPGFQATSVFPWQPHTSDDHRRHPSPESFGTLCAVCRRVSAGYNRRNTLI